MLYYGSNDDRSLHQRGTSWDELKVQVTAPRAFRISRRLVSLQPSTRSYVWEKGTLDLLFLWTSQDRDFVPNASQMWGQDFKLFNDGSSVSPCVILKYFFLYECCRFASDKLNDNKQWCLSAIYAQRSWIQRKEHRRGFLLRRWKNLNYSILKNIMSSKCYRLLQMAGIKNTLTSFNFSQPIKSIS